MTSERIRMRSPISLTIPSMRIRMDSMRVNLWDWMVNTEDSLLAAFDAREDPARLQQIYLELDATALQRAETLQWKRYKNRAGGTGGLRSLYKVD